MFATNATDRVILPASAPRAAVVAAAAAGIAVVAAREASAEDARSATSATVLGTSHATARMEQTDAIVVTAKGTSPKTAIRAQTLRLVTTATSRVISLVRVRRHRTIPTTGVSHSLATIATKWDTYRETARITLRHVMSVTSLATSVVIVIRTVGSKPSSKEECTSIWFWVFGIFKSWCCNSSLYLYPLDITTMQSDKALLGSNVHSSFLSGLH